MAATARVVLYACLMWTAAGSHAQRLTFRGQLKKHSVAESLPEYELVTTTRHTCNGTGHLGLTCLFFDLVLWQKQFYYITTENISIPNVREGWHMWWHPYGEAILPEHVSIVHPLNLPWDSDTHIDYLDQALIYNWLDQANMYHVMMETGNFIYATACKLLGACSYADSHFQILSTGYFKFGEDKGLPAGHESLKCLSSRLPLWIGDPQFDNKVVVIGKTAVGIGVQCDDPKCEWDSVPYMQNGYTSGHRQLMLDCLNVTESEPSQQDTQVVIVQRLLSRGRSMLNILEVHDAIAETGAHVQVFSTEGKTLRQQAEALAHSHIYILIHGAAMALYMFLPRNAAIIEIQHFYAHSPAFPSNMYHRTVDKYDLGYHHEIMIMPRSQDLVFNQKIILEDEVYRELTTKQQMLLWEQGTCPGNEDDLKSKHCVSKWVFLANMVIDVDQLRMYYQSAWQSLPSVAMPVAQ